MIRKRNRKDDKQALAKFSMLKWQDMSKTQINSISNSGSLATVALPTNNIEANSIYNLYVSVYLKNANPTSFS